MLSLQAKVVFELQGGTIYTGKGFPAFCLQPVLHRGPRTGAKTEYYHGGKRISGPGAKHSRVSTAASTRGAQHIGEARSSDPLGAGRALHGSTAAAPRHGTALQ